MEHKRFTDKELEFIKSRYGEIGASATALAMGRPRSSIVKLVHQMKLPNLSKERLNQIFIRRYTKGNDQYAVNPLQFTENITKESVYILGFLWADGYVFCDSKKSPITAQLSQKDEGDIVPVFLSTGQWRIYHGHAGCSNFVVIKTNNRPLASFLLENDYGSKTTCGATKIISTIPDDFKSYWYRGLSDGDGCFYIGGSTCQFSIDGPFDQDWRFIELIWNQMGIKHSVSRRRRKLSSSSCIRISNRRGCIAWGNYIYNNFEQDQIGLRRKYEKLQQMELMDFTSSHISFIRNKI